MKKEYMRQKLMESAIHVVATEGIHKATTKAIATIPVLTRCIFIAYLRTRTICLRKRLP